MIKVGVDRKALHAAWDEIAASGHLTEGKYTRLFEEAVSEWSGGLYAVAVNSAGSGLFALYRQRGPSKVLVPSNSFIATGSMASEAGHAVSLADCSTYDLSVGLDQLAEACVKSTPGVFTLTHVGGILAQDYAEMARFCFERGIAFYEDAAHCLGVKVEGRVAGALSEAAVYSLYPTKAVPVGEGGVVVTRHRDVADYVREFRNYGKHVENGVIKYRDGFNLRMDEWTAAVAYLQMKRLPELLERREEAAQRLMQVVEPLTPWKFTPCNWYKYPVAADPKWKRQAGKVYAVSDQLTTSMFRTDPLPNCAWVAENHVCLPIGEGAYEGWAPGEIEYWLQGGEHAGA